MHVTIVQRLSANGFHIVNIYNSLKAIKNMSLLINFTIMKFCNFFFWQKLN